MSTSLLVSLAFLKVNWDSNRTIFLDNFLPFLAECIKVSKENVISQNVLQSELKTQFGLDMPLHVIKALLARARKLGIVRLENNVYYRHDIESYGTQFQTNQERVQRIYNALLENFCNYALTKYSRQISLEDAENTLLAFISYNQLCVYRLNEEDRSFSDVPSLSRDLKVITCDYISHVRLADPQVFDYLDTIVKGYMIFNAIYLPDLHNTNRKFRKTKVFLDTTFIMHALGYSGEELQAPCRELLEMLYTTLGCSSLPRDS